MNLALLIITATIPFSLIGLKLIQKIFYKHESDLSKIRAICTNIIGSLTKKELEIKTVIFNDHRAEIQKDQTMITLENISTKEKIEVEQNYLRQDETLHLAAITSTLCGYPKMRDIEEKTMNFLTGCGFKKYQIEKNHQIIQKIPSNETKKISTTVARNMETGEIFSFTKGNPFEILKRCTRILIRDKKIELTHQSRRRLKKRIEKLNKKGQKVIAFAYKPLPVKQLDNYSEEFTENDLVLTVIIGLLNPINTEVETFVKQAKETGIKIYILTRAKEKKAVAIARQLGIINERYFETVTGPQLKQFNNQKLAKIFKNNETEKDYIFAEMDDEDKQKIIETLGQQKISFALINKENPQSLAKVLKGIEKYKQHKENYKKCRIHAIGCCIAELFLIAIILLLQAPLILGVSLIIIIDLAVNLPLELNLKSKTNKDSTEISKSHIALIGLTLGIIITAIYIWNILRFGWIPGNEIPGDSALIGKSNAMIFSLLAILQIFSAYSLGKSVPILANLYLLLTSVIVILIVYILTTFPGLYENLSLSPLEFIDWIIIIFVSFGLILIEKIRDVIANEAKKSHH